MIFEIFSVRKKLRKLEKFSENIAKNFRNVSFSGKKNRAKNRNVRRDLVAMQQDVLLQIGHFLIKLCCNDIEISGNVSHQNTE